MAKSSTDPGKRDKKAGDPASRKATGPQDGKTADPTDSKPAGGTESTPPAKPAATPAPDASSAETAGKGTGSSGPETKTGGADEPKATRPGNPPAPPKAMGPGETPRKHTGLKDTGLKDTGATRTPPENAEARNTGPKDTGSKNTAAKNTGEPITSSGETPAGKTPTSTASDGNRPSSASTATPGPGENGPGRNGQNGGGRPSAARPGDDGEGRSLAARALMLLIFALVILGFSFWLVPKVAPYLPAEIARHLVPGQARLDSELAAMNADVTATTASLEAGLTGLRDEIATLTHRVATVEDAALKAQASAPQSAAADAERIAVADEAVARAEAAAAEASQMADTATTAAAEASKSVAAATRDIAALSQRVDEVDNRMAQLSAQMQAISETLAKGGADGEAATPELAASVAALQARLDTMREQLGDDSDFLTTADAGRFATREDLRAARLAMRSEIQEAVTDLPPAQAIVVTKELAGLRAEAEDAMARLSARIDEVKTIAGQAASTASAAEQAAGKAVGQVDEVIRKARLNATSAALTSRLLNGTAFADTLDEAATLKGTAPPDALTAVADKGVATTAELLRDFGQAARDAVEANIETQTGGGILGRARARIGSVVTGRPASEQQGDTVGAILSRIEARLDEADAAAALAEAETLPEDARTALDGWLERLKARVTAIEAARQWLAPADAADGATNGATDNAEQG